MIVSPRMYTTLDNEMNMLLWKFVLVSLLQLSSAYKILLFFPVPGRSHAILGEGYVRSLLDAGNEVTYITPFLIKNPHPRLRQIDVSSNYELMPVDKCFDVKKIIEAEINIKDLTSLLDSTTNFANGTLLHPNVQRLIHDTTEHFDAVIAEWLYSELYSGLATVFGCPFIWSSSIEPHALVLDLIDDVLNPSYNPGHLSNIVPPFNFLGRVHELWLLINQKIFKWRLTHRENKIFDNVFSEAIEKRGRNPPSYNEARYNASLMLGNSHPAAGTPIRLPQNYISVGGYHIPAKIDPLPMNVQRILDEAQNGLIYFSLGSMLKSSRIPKKMRMGLINAFDKLNQTILWKVDEQLPDLPKNVHIIPWAPQLGILAHPNCKLFITHGGLLSIFESLHFGVPIIGIPIFGDQHLNVNRAVQKGYAKRVDMNNEIGVNMEAAIREVLNDDYYTKKIKEYSLIYHDRLTSPGKVLAHWVSHVIRTNGANYLRSPTFVVPWHQRLYLDLLLLIVITSYLLLWVLIRIFNFVILFRCRFWRIKQKLM